MRQKLYTILIALVVSAITTQAMAQVNMDRYITLPVSQGKEIYLNFAADAANTPVRIVSGTTDQTLTVGTDWYGGKYYLAQASTMTIYGNVAKFSCEDNELTTLDVSKNTALTVLYCYHNQLTTLDVSKNTELTVLSCNNNKLTTLDVSKNTALTELYCFHNQLKYLNVANGNNANFDYGSDDAYPPFDATNNPDLKVIYIDKGFTPPTSPVRKEWRKDPTAAWDDKFTPPAGTPVIDMTTTGNGAINVGMSTKALHMPVWVETGPGTYETRLSYRISTVGGDAYNAFVNCDVSGKKLRVHGDIKGLSISVPHAAANKVEAIDVSGSPNLEEIVLNNHALTKLDIGNNPKIRMVEIKNNRLTELNLANGTNAFFDSKNNARPAVDVTDNARLSNITVDPDFFPDNLSGSKEWRKDAAANWIAGTVIPVPPAGTAVMEITTSYNASIYLEMMTKEAYTPVWVETKPDVYQFHYGANNEILKTYTVSGNKLRVYGDVSHLALGDVGAKVTALDVSKNKALETLYCYGTHVSSIDVSKNPNLRILEVDNNKLTYLNIMNGHNSAMKGVKATGNPNLRDIYIDAFFDPGQTAAGITWKKDATARWVPGGDGATPPTGTPWVELTMTAPSDEDYPHFIVFMPEGLIPPYIWIEAPIGTIFQKNLMGSGDGLEWDIPVEGTKVRIHGYFKSLEAYGHSAQLKKVDVSHHPYLTNITCADTEITEFDVSNNKELLGLSCVNNPKLTSLNVRENKKLHLLWCRNNALTSLYVANGNNANFESSGSSYPAFDATGNPGLKTINVDEGFDPTGLTGKKEWRKDAAASWSSLTGLPSLSAQGIKIWGGKGVIHITSAELDEAKTVHVYNVSGALVRTLPFGYGEMLVTNIPAGIYMVKIGDAAEKVVVR